MLDFDFERFYSVFAGDRDLTIKQLNDPGHASGEIPQSRDDVLATQTERTFLESYLKGEKCKALVTKRGEIAGKIADLQTKVREYQDDLVHLDHALRLFDPNISGWGIRAKRPKARTKGYFQHGELSRRIYEAFREQEWITAAEIADKAMHDKRPSDKGIRAIFIANFLVRLGQLHRARKLEKGSGRGRSVRSKLAGA